MPVNATQQPKYNQKLNANCIGIQQVELLLCAFQVWAFYLGHLQEFCKLIKNIIYI